jgi:hypothetical protein
MPHNHGIPTPLCSQRPDNHTQRNASTNTQFCKNRAKPASENLDADFSGFLPIPALRAALLCVWLLGRHEQGGVGMPWLWGIIWVQYNPQEESEGEDKKNLRTVG